MESFANGQPEMVAPGLVEWREGNPKLVGSRCSECGEHRFPASTSCPACLTENVEKVALPDRGTLWTYTVQRFPPPSPPFSGPVEPDRFEPYAVGYIDLPGALRVESRLAECDFDALAIGMPMKLAVASLSTHASDERVHTFVFVPV